MNANEAREIFDAMVAKTTDPDRRAELELCREYFCNREFRAAFSDLVFTTNGANSGR